MSSLHKRSRAKGKAKGYKSAAYWPSTEDIDGYFWNPTEPPAEAEPTGPTKADADWAADALNQGDAGHAIDDPPDEYYDALADEAAAQDRLDRGLCL